MSNEDLKPTVPQMLRMTGANTAQFMEQVSLHVEKLEAELAQAKQRVEELERAQDDFK